MNRLLLIAPLARPGRGITLALVVGLSTACEVERTPPEYLDKGAVIETEREAAAREVQDRLLALTQALNRGSGSEVMTALDPADDAYVVGPEGESVVRGAGEIRTILAEMVAAGGDVEMRDLEVRIGPQTNVAWFRGALHSTGESPETPGAGVLRVTGVYLRDAGLWKLVQAHLSRPVSSLPPPSSPEGPAADSAAGE